VVDEDSAVLGLPNELVIPVSADHRSMCRFSTAESQKYRPVEDAIVSVVRTICCKESIGLYLATKGIDQVLTCAIYLQPTGVTIRRHSQESLKLRVSKEVRLQGKRGCHCHRPRRLTVLCRHLGLSTNRKKQLALYQEPPQPRYRE
jgi:hypothetical protein